MSRERIGVGVGVAGRGGSPPSPGGMESGFLQELPKEGKEWNPLQTHLAFVRDRPRGESKNIRGKAATQRESAGLVTRYPGWGPGWCL